MTDQTKQPSQARQRQTALLTTDQSTAATHNEASRPRHKTTISRHPESIVVHDTASEEPSILLGNIEPLPGQRFGRKGHTANIISRILLAAFTAVLLFGSWGMFAIGGGEGVIGGILTIVLAMISGLGFFVLYRRSRAAKIELARQVAEAEISRLRRLKTALVSEHGEELGTALFEQEVTKLDISRQTLAASRRAAAAAEAPRMIIGF